jgi:hypothetical protein
MEIFVYSVIANVVMSYGSVRNVDEKRLEESNDPSAKVKEALFVRSGCSRVASLKAGECVRELLCGMLTGTCSRILTNPNSLNPGAEYSRSPGPR